VSDAAAAEAKLLPEAPLLVLPSLAVAVGLNDAIVLQQLHYRSRVSADGWWRAGFKELCREFPFWSEATIKRTLTSLRQAGFVEARQLGTDRANRYRIDYSALREQVRATGGQIDPVERVTLASKRSGASDQSAPIPIGGKRNNNKRGEASLRRVSSTPSTRDPSDYDKAVQ
jgi:hypothetical protein